jgi:hypothetical protein
MKTLKLSARGPVPGKVAMLRKGRLADFLLLLPPFFHKSVPCPLLFLELFYQITYLGDLIPNYSESSQNSSPRCPENAVSTDIRPAITLHPQYHSNIM